MGRWSILDVEQACTTTAQRPSENRPQRQTGEAARSVSRVTRNESVAGRSIPPARTRATSIPRSEDRRTLHEDRGRSYSLRESEIQAMSDIGRFRTVDAHD